MKTSGTGNKPSNDSPNQNTREELEHLIDLAPTAIHRQALQQQLMAMAETDKEIDNDEEADKKIEKADVPVKQDNKAVGKTDVSIKQNNTVTEETNVTDILVEQVDTIVEEVDIPVKSDGTVVEKDISVKSNSTAIEELDMPVKQEHTENREVDVSAEQVETIVEEVDTPVKQDGATVEKEDISVEQVEMTVGEFDPLIEKDDISVEKDNVTIEETDMPIEQDKITTTSIETLDENNHAKVKQTDISVEEDALLKQGKQADNFYVYMRPKSHFSPKKIALSITAIVLISAIAVMLIRQNSAITGSTTPAEITESGIKDDMGPTTGNDTETFGSSVKHMIAQIKTLWEDEHIESSSATIKPTSETKFSSQDAALKMYETKSMALDSLLEFDEFIRWHGIPQPQQQAEIKALLQSAKAQQKYQQYDEATDFYRQVNDKLAGLMSTSQQLLAKKGAAELARLNWESYRWNFHRATKNLSLTDQEMMLISLETKTDAMVEEGILQQSLATYEDIEHQYTGLLNEVKEVAKARTSVESIQQQWHQFRDKHGLADVATITEIEQAYRNGIKFETEGNYQAAIDSYLLASDQYTKVLEAERAKQNQK